MHPTISTNKIIGCHFTKANGKKQPMYHCIGGNIKTSTTTKAKWKKHEALYVQQRYYIPNLPITLTSAAYINILIHNQSTNIHTPNQYTQSEDEIRFSSWSTLISPQSTHTKLKSLDLQAKIHAANTPELSRISMSLLNVCQSSPGELSRHVTPIVTPGATTQRQIWKQTRDYRKHDAWPWFFDCLKALAVRIWTW